jgi:hypothetical protein
MTDDLAAAVLAGWRHRMDRALERDAGSALADISAAPPNV